jgi:hypothetical protein
MRQLFPKTCSCPRPENIRFEARQVFTLEDGQRQQASPVYYRNTEEQFLVGASTQDSASTPTVRRSGQLS